MSPILKVYISCCVLMFGSAFSVTMILSYLPFLVKFLLPHVAERNIGRYSGIIDASMFVGRIIGGFIWGRLADVWSRKNVFMWSAVGIAISCLLFGFSTNFIMAIVTRFFVGLLNGVVGNAKASVSHYTKQSRRALGMSVMICFWAAGFVAGQAVSGAVADPIDQYDLPSNSFLEKYPYCLPGIICALINVIAAITTFCLFPEDGQQTNKKVSSEQQELLTDSEQLQAENNNIELLPTVMGSHDVAVEDNVRSPDATLEDSVRSHDTIVERSHNTTVERSHDATLEDIVRSHDATVEDSARSHDATVAGNTEVSVTGISYRQLLQQDNIEYDKILDNETSDCESSVLERESEDESSKMLNTKQGMVKQARKAFTSTFTVTLSILRDKVSFGVLMNYTLLSIVVIGFDETYPLWAAGSPELGGLGFSIRKIAMSQAIIGVALLPFTLFYFPTLEKYFGTTMAFIINCLLASVCSILLPSLTYVSESPVLLWSLLVTLLLIIRVSIVTCITAGSLLINNATTSDKLGTMNGIALTMLSAGRGIAPVMMGSVYSFSLSPNNQRIGFPVDFHLTFILNSALLTLCVAVAAFYPKSLDNR